MDPSHPMAPDMAELRSLIQATQRQRDVSVAAAGTNAVHTHSLTHHPVLVSELSRH